MVSSAPTANEEEGVMEVGAVPALEELDEVEPEEDDVAVDPEEARATRMEPDDEVEEDPDADLEEEEEDEGSEELDGEEPEETKKGLEAGVVAEDGAKGLVQGSAVDDMNDKIEGEHVKGGVENKDEVVDILSNGDDVGGSRNGDVQNSELDEGLELLIDELPKNCVEGDIAMVFSECAEIKSIRIIRNSSTEKSKDIAFVCFASIEAAGKALTEFKKGIEVKGIKVRVSSCQDNNTLFLGNISKSWTKDQVLTALNNIGVPKCKLSLPSRNNKGKNRGFAFLKFGSHYYARAAFRRLMKSDVTFGIDRSVTVSFYRKPTKLSDDVMEAKRVYLEHVPLYWNEDKIKECCEEYGKILNVDLFQISKNAKSEIFSFVEFSSSKSALACVEGINNAKIVDGSFKLSACLAQPKNGATLEGATTSKKEYDHTEKLRVDKNSVQKLRKSNKGKLTSQTKEVVVKKNAPSKLLKDNDRKIASQKDVELQQTSKPSERKRKLGKNGRTSVNPIPSEKAKNNLLQTSPSKGKRKSGKDVNTYINERPLKKARKIRDVRQPNRSKGAGQFARPQYSRDPYGPGESLRSKAYIPDLEPHAGYIPPANQVYRTQPYDQRRTRQYNIHRTDVHPYAREAAPSRSTYSDYTGRAHYQNGYEYIYPPSGSYYPGRGPFTRGGDY